MAPTELGQRLTDVELPTLSYTEAKPLDLLADTSADDACQDKDGILREQDLEDHTLYLPNKQLIFLVATIALSYCLAVMEQSMLASALPSIASHFRGGKESAWVALSFLIGAAAGQMFCGRVCDIWGRRSVMLVSTVMFFVTTALCAFSTSLMMLIACRALQGLSSDGINTSATILIADSIPMSKRAKYQGIIDGICLVGQACGPLIGSGLVSFSVKAVFWVQLPSICLAFVMQWFFVPRRTVNVVNWRVKLRSIDWGGCFLSLAFTILLLVGLLRGGVEAPWISAEVLGPLVASLVALAGFCIWELHVAALPLLPLRIFANRDVVGVMFSTLMSFAATFIVIYGVPTFAQVARGLSLIESGLVILPYGMCTTIFVFVSIVLCKFVSIRAIIFIGTAIWSVGVGLLVRLAADTPMSIIFAISCTAGIGCGLAIVLSSIQLQAALPRSHIAVGISTRGYVRLLGGAIGTALSSVVVLNGMSAELDALGLDKALKETILVDPPSIQHSLRDSLEPEVRTRIINAYISAYRILWYIGAGFLVASLVVSIALFRKYSLNRDGDDELELQGKAWAREQKLAKLAAKEKGEDAA